MTQRERNLAMIVAGVALLAGAAYGGTKYFDERSALSDQIAEAELEKSEADRTLTQQARAARDLARWKANGLQPNPSLAEQHLFVAGTRWRADAGVGFVATDSANKPKPEGGYDRIEQKMTVTGKQAQVARLLWDIEKTPLPVKIAGLSLTSKEGRDELTAQVTLAALCEQAPKAAPAGRTK